MSRDLLTMVEVLAHEKNVDQSVVLAALESALASAVKKAEFPGEDADIVVKVDPTTGDQKVWRQWLVVPDEQGLQEPDRQIHLVNSRAAGGKMDLIFLLFDRYLASNPDTSFEDACAYFDSLEQNSKILFSLCNYENLAKAGRIPKAAGVIANKLNIRILGTASEAGEIELVGHTRGEKKMFTKIINTMEAEGFTGGEVIIDHVENEAGAQALADRIVEHWPGSKTIIMPCNGLDSYYAEMHGLIIGYGMGVASGK